jgi:hypothetical protein
MKRLSHYALLGLFDTWLNNMWDRPRIAGTKYNTSDALKQIDKVRYYEYFDDWLKTELEFETILFIGNAYYESDEGYDEKNG